MHFVFVCSVLTVSQRNLNEEMKIETKQLTRYVGAPVLLLFPVSKEDVAMLMQERQQGVVPGRLRIPCYHFTSGQYAWEHSNVAY